MKNNRDHFDRGFASSSDRNDEKESRQPVITSRRGPRWIDFTHCPHCFFPRVGISYQGELSSGKKIFELATHSAGSAVRQSGKPRCPGSNVRLEKTADGWRKSV